jgi:hypothetical protein
MAVVNISGVAYESISSIGGVTKASITDIGGVTPGPVGPTCTTLYLGYSDGRRRPPSDACLDTPQPYDYDSASGVLYTSGGCGNPAFIATAGFYSGGGIIYDYTNGTLVTWGSCPR